MITFEKVTSILNSRFEATIEFREGSYMKEHNDLRFGGARILEIEDEEIVVSVNHVGGTGITLFDFDLDGIRFGGKLIKETAEEKAERESASLKAELIDSGKTFEVDRRNYEFKFGQSVFVSRNKPMPVDFGDDVIVIARPYNTRYEGKVQHYLRDGDHYLVVVKPEDFRSTYEEWQAEQKAKEKAAQAEKNKKTAEVRKAAGMLGGKALKGTARQKAWAEEIRAKAIKRVEADVAQKLLTDAKYQHAKFWIENRKALESGNVLSVM